VEKKVKKVITDDGENFKKKMVIVKKMFENEVNFVDGINLGMN